MIERWPLAEVLTIYIQILQQELLTEWRHQTLLWQIRSTVAKKPGNPPAIPPLLKSRFKL